jgi:hypothetical protein
MENTQETVWKNIKVSQALFKLKIVLEKFWELIKVSTLELVWMCIIVFNQAVFKPKIKPMKAQTKLNYVLLVV